eukprot:TRINITY_DN13971_c0_g1_i1.p1 TRINITY_DN13971_c0_g1~~TRINITY_DN13971_c0_g1_i1.p1  ORF type:complete len:182 (-),score=61.81 TRINITY_DN13971_c0_g1_i1:39-584(-)
MAAAEREEKKPTVQWAQRKDSIYLVVDVQDAGDLKVDLGEASLEFHCRDSDGNRFGFDLPLYSAIRRQDSKWSTKRCPEFFLRKEKDATWPRLQKEGKLQWVKVDWGKWADSDEEDEKGGFDTGDMQGLDFSGVSQQEVEEGSDDRDSILADLDEDIAITTDEEDAEPEAKQAFNPPSRAT